jgi:hypothetical protein
MPITSNEVASFDSKILDKAVKNLDRVLSRRDTEHSFVVQLNEKTTATGSLFWNRHPTTVRELVNTYTEAGWSVTVSHNSYGVPALKFSHPD